LAARSRVRPKAAPRCSERWKEPRLLDLRELDLPMLQPRRRRADRGGRGTDRDVTRPTACSGAARSTRERSPALKNALDWLHLLGPRDPPYLHDKVIGLITAAGGTQGLQAINTMEFAARALGGWAVPYVVPVAAAARVFDPAGRIRDESIELQLATLGGEVVRVAQRFAAGQFASPRDRVCMRSRKGRSLWITTQRGKRTPRFDSNGAACEGPRVKSCGPSGSQDLAF
jgi:FMN reductase